MPLKDPPRLLDPGAGAPEALREAVAAGRAEVPRADQLARLARRLPIGGAGPPGGGGAPLAPPVSMAPGAVVGALLGLAVIGLHALVTRPEPAPILVEPRAPIAIPAAPAKETAVSRVEAATPGRVRADPPAPTASR